MSLLCKHTCLYTFLNKITTIQCYFVSGNTGGYLGLFLGISMLNFYEFFFVLIQMLRFYVAKMFHKKSTNQ